MKLVISSETTLTLRAIADSFLAIGLLLTILRLAYRIWLRRFWLEDAWAAVAFLCGLAALTTTWTYIKGVEEEVLISFWIYSVSLDSAIWAVRESILFSIARIVYGTQHLRRLSLGLSVLFFGMWAVVVGQKAWQYGHSILTHSGGLVYGFVTRPMIVYELTIDCLSVTILVVLPLRILWSLKLPRRQKRMIIAIFTSSIIVASASIFRTVCQINKYGAVAATAADFEMALSLLVCNLLVLVTFLYRRFGFVNADEDASSSTSDDDYTTRNTIHTTTRLTTDVLTTVDLDDPGARSDERTELRMQAKKSSTKVKLDTPH